MALENLFAQNMGAPMPVSPNGTQQVMNSLEQVLSPTSSYIQNARRRGMETAAARGGINSSIAAGASERAALEAAAPIVQQGLAIDQVGQNAQYDNWLQGQNFNRQLQGSVFNNSLGALNAVGEMALQDPELYTPDVVSGYSNFFNQNMADILKTYFGNAKSGGTI